MLWWLSLLLLLWEVHSTVIAFFPQAPKLKLGLITSTWLNLINSKIFTIIHHPYCCYIYIYIYIYPVQHVCTFLSHTPAYIIIYYVPSILYCTFYFIAHLILLYFIFSYIHVYSLVLCSNILHCPLRGPDLIYISLLIIFCIIEYVTNKTLKQ